jgi:hypothetical protein
MASARARMPAAGDATGAEHARRGAPRKGAEAGHATPAGALGGLTEAGSAVRWGQPPPARLDGPGAGAAGVSAVQLLRLQRAYGNAAVRGHLQPKGTAAPAPERAPVGQGGGAPARVQRWKDDGHIKTTEDAAKMVFPPVSPFFTTIGMTQTAFIKRVAQASINMDKIVPHLGDRFAPGFGETKFWSFTATLVSSALGDLLPGNQRKGQTRRGIKGEGPDHGEAGYYDIPRASAVAGNVARTDKYVSEAVQAYKDKDFDLMIDRLGDACHVSADRGSHAEGGQGQGHDTRMPDPEKGEKGTNLQANPPFMENWADNDIMGLNPDGYRWGLICTIEVLQDFFERQRDVSQGIDLDDL